MVENCTWKSTARALHDGGGAGGQLIDVSAEWQQRYWSHKWNVTPLRIAEAVMRVGSRVDSVAKELCKAN
jgi:hypothetical protein